MRPQVGFGHEAVPALVRVDEDLAAGRLCDPAERAAERAAELAAMPTRGVGLTKRLFDHAENATLEEQLEFEAQLQSVATGTADFREGVAAFLEKREPRFEGR